MRRFVCWSVLLAGGLSCCCAWSQQARPAITGIAFVRFYSSDLNASDALYGKELGYAKVVGADGRVRYGVSESQWIELEKLPANPPASKMAEVAFTTRDVRGMKRFLAEHHVPVEAAQGKSAFTVRDPEGNLIGFVQQDAMRGKVKLSARATSRRMIHTGFVVHDRAAEDAFYKDLLGFQLYWSGGMTGGHLDWVAMQVPDGTDWLEYMLNRSPELTAKQLGVMNHISLGVAHMSDAIAALARNGCEGPQCRTSQMGKDGKVQLNVFDPDLTRIEFMEFAPSGETCCSPISGRTPREEEDR
jgi:catechol 2,3-dioxygenase-like lactoylglutathione lyase family enzyme